MHLIESSNCVRQVHWARPPPGGFPPPSWREPGAFEPLYAGFPQAHGDVGVLGDVMAGGPAYEMEMDAQAELAMQAQAQAQLVAAGGGPHGGFGLHGPPGFHDYHAHHGGPAGKCPAQQHSSNADAGLRLRNLGQVSRSHTGPGHSKELCYPVFCVSCRLLSCCVTPSQPSQKPNAKCLICLVDPFRHGLPRHDGL